MKTGCQAGAGSERSRLIFYILSARMQGGAQSDEGMSKTQSLRGCHTQSDGLSSRLSVVGPPQRNVKRSASVLMGISEWCLVDQGQGVFPVSGLASSGYWPIRGGSERRGGALADTILTGVREHMANKGADGNSWRLGGERERWLL